MKFFDKMKVAKEAAKLGVSGTQGAINQIQEQDKKFKEKELEILGKFEDKLDKVISQNNLILNKLNRFEEELK